MSSSDTPNSVLETAVHSLWKLQDWILSCFKLSYQDISNRLQEMLSFLGIPPGITKPQIVSEPVKIIFDERLKMINLHHNNNTAVAVETLDGVNNWCLILDYVNYWQKKIYKTWCVLTGCLEEPNDNSSTSLIVNGNASAVEPNQYISLFGLEIDREVLKKYGTIALITFAGFATFLGYVHLQKRIRIKRQEEKEFHSSIAKLIQSVEAIRTFQEQLKQELKNSIHVTDTCNQNYRTESITIANLRKEVSAFRHELRKNEETSNDLKIAINKNGPSKSITKELNNLQSVSKENCAFLHNLNEELQEVRMQLRELQEKFTQSQEATKQQNSTVVPQAIEEIAKISRKTHSLEGRIQVFNGTKEDKEYLNIHELLIRNVISLDNIESNDNDLIRSKRREAVGYVNTCFSLLEDRVRQK